MKKFEFYINLEGGKKIRFTINAKDFDSAVEKSLQTTRGYNFTEHQQFHVELTKETHLSDDDRYAFYCQEGEDLATIYDGDYNVAVQFAKGDYDGTRKVIYIDKQNPDADIFRDTIASSARAWLMEHQRGVV